MDAAAHQIVHQIVARRDAVEDRRAPAAPSRPRADGDSRARRRRLSLPRSSGRKIPPSDRARHAAAGGSGTMSDAAGYRHPRASGGPGLVREQPPWIPAFAGMTAERMPELPEVETVRRGLALKMTGRRIVRAELRRPDLRRPFPPELAERLGGAEIGALGRRGKYILIELDDDGLLLLHLGMSGRITAGDATAADGAARPCRADPRRRHRRALQRRAPLRPARLCPAQRGGRGTRCSPGSAPSRSGRVSTAPISPASSPAR